MSAAVGGSTSSTKMKIAYITFSRYVYALVILAYLFGRKSDALANNIDELANSEICLGRVRSRYHRLSNRPYRYKVFLLVNCSDVALLDLEL